MENKDEKGLNLPDHSQIGDNKLKNFFLGSPLGIFGPVIIILMIILIVISLI